MKNMYYTYVSFLTLRKHAIINKCPSSSPQTTLCAVVHDDCLNRFIAQTLLFAGVLVAVQQLAIKGCDCEIARSVVPLGTRRVHRVEPRFVS